MSTKNGSKSQVSINANFSQQKKNDFVSMKLIRGQFLNDGAAVKVILLGWKLSHVVFRNVK